VPKLRASEVEWAIEKLNSYKPADNDQIPAVLLREGGRIIRYEIHNVLFTLGIKRNC